MGEVFKRICDKYELCIASCCIDEVRDVMSTKFTNSDAGLYEFFSNIPYTLVETPDTIDTSLFKIRDSDDYPILYTAIIGQVDVFITVDKDFFYLRIDRPEILTPADFMDKY